MRGSGSDWEVVYLCHVCYEGGWETMKYCICAMCVMMEDGARLGGSVFASCLLWGGGSD